MSTRYELKHVFCKTVGCLHMAREEFFGVCTGCWFDATPEDRVLLQGNFREVVDYRTVITHIPPKPWWGWRVLGGTFKAAQAAAVAWLLWRASK